MINTEIPFYLGLDTNYLRENATPTIWSFENSDVGISITAGLCVMFQN